MLKLWRLTVSSFLLKIIWPLCPCIKLPLLGDLLLLYQLHTSPCRLCKPLELGSLRCSLRLCLMKRCWPLMMNNCNRVRWLCPGLMHAMDICCFVHTLMILAQLSLVYKHLMLVMMVRSLSPYSFVSCCPSQI